MALMFQYILSPQTSAKFFVQLKATVFIQRADEII